ncbi:MAG: ABC transporter permease [Anaerolineae bacterium]|nr:ABC transporter permease [Anaerolineae bacterium]
MWTIFRHALRRSRGQILGWGLVLALLGAWIITLYPAILSQGEQYRQLFKAYPPEMLAFFGGVTDLTEPVAYLDFVFFSYMPIVIAIYAILAGSGLLVADEESGVLDLILAHPISRTRLYLGRFLAFATSVLAILALTWLGFVVPLPGSGLDVGAGAMALPCVSLFAVLLLFGALALFLSLLLPSRGAAASVAGLVLVASYFASSLSRLNPDLQALDRVLPLRYYQGAAAVNGLDWGELGILLGAAALFALLGWALFARRDIRVGGEAGWRLPRARRSRAAA